jgi:MFS family permease
MEETERSSDRSLARRMLALLAIAELLGMSLWFTASAISPQLREAWGLDATQAAWLTTIVQLGFVAGTAVAAVMNLADLIPARTYFAVAAVLAAIANALLVAAPGYVVALALRFLTGFFLAAVYPPAMKMVATWYRAGRGLAIGTVVGALTLGKATPYLARAIGGQDAATVILAASAGAVVAALLVLAGYRDGPYAFPRRPFSWRRVGAVVTHRPTRLAIAGYLGHMWELYAMWALVALFFRDYLLARGAAESTASTVAGVVGFGSIAMGAIGSVLAGAWADRLGRERVTIWAMAVSGTCSLVIGWLTAAPAPIVVAVALAWGFAIVADSAQFSAIVTEVAPEDAVGTALTLQTSLGFALTAGSIWLAAEIASRIGWGLAFTLLAIGPALGIASMARLAAVRATGAPIPATGRG